MLQFDSDNILTSTRDFLANGFTVIDLLNYKLTDAEVIRALLQKNNIPPSSNLPGLIIQAYLLLARELNLEVFMPINNTVAIEETISQQLPVVPKVEVEVIYTENIDPEPTVESFPPSSEFASSYQDNRPLVFPDTFHIENFDPESNNERSLAIAEIITDNEDNEPKAKKAKVILECPMCNETFESKVHRKEHVENSHLDAKWRCKYCLVEHPSYKKLNHHFYHKHKSFECKECEETFSTFHYYNMHKMKVHKGKNVECPYCGKMFYKRSLKEHIRNIHETGEFPCDQCDKIFPSKNYLTSHKIQRHPVVEKEKTFHCDFCDGKFISAALLQSHVNFSHTIEPVKCEICGNTYDNQLKLRCHIDRVHNEENRRKLAEKPKERWQCHICNTVLVGKNINQSKKTHLETHEEPKYACEICGKQFRQKSGYQSHLNAHNGINNFECKECNKVSCRYKICNV